MADSPPKGKAIDYSRNYISVNIPHLYVPELGADRWRRAVLHQPVAGVCQNRLISYVQATNWTIEPVDGSKINRYKADIEYYTRLLDDPGSDFDMLSDLILQDALTLPIGGTAEVVRYKPGPVTAELDGHAYKLADNPRGHIHRLDFIDGATLFPTGDVTMPLLQRLNADQVIFRAREVLRVVLSPRPEYQLRGYGMPPIAKIYLAVLMLYYGDTYYAKLLLDTPEAGILYLGDMTQESADEWLAGFRDLYAGPQPLKVPVLAETETPPQFIRFGGDPATIAYDSTTTKYARLVASGYGLKLSDVGLDSGQETLAGKIRDDRAARSTGFGVLITKLENSFNRCLPPYLKLRFNIHDEEALIQLMRSRLMAGQAAKVLIEAGVAKAEELQAQFKQEGLLTVDLSLPDGGGNPPGSNNGTVRKPREVNKTAELENEMNRVPAELGGQGDTPGVKRSLSQNSSVPLIAYAKLRKLADESQVGLTGTIEAIKRWSEDGDKFTTVRSKADGDLTGDSAHALARLIEPADLDRLLADVSQIEVLRATVTETNEAIRQLALPVDPEERLEFWRDDTSQSRRDILDTIIAALATTEPVASVLVAYLDSRLLADKTPDEQRIVEILSSNMFISDEPERDTYDEHTILHTG